MLITKVWFALRRDGPMAPRQIRERIIFRRKRPSMGSVYQALKVLRGKGSVCATGFASQRLYTATRTRPIDMTGRAAGSAFGRAIGSELTRQAAWNSCGIIPSGIALEKEWPMFGTTHALKGIS